jgi:DNA-binding response OmpR family regulator
MRAERASQVPVESRDSRQVSPATDILLVEDDPGIREGLSELLSMAGAHVEVACDGVEAWDRLIEGRRPSVILLDLFLPRLGGEALLARIRATSTMARLSVVTMTAAMLPPPAGADDHLCKPFDIGRLLAVVERCAEGGGHRLECDPPERAAR